MQNYNHSSKKASPSAPARWRSRFFGRPALRRLTRYQRIYRRSAASWTDAERAYLELKDLADAFPAGLATAICWFAKDAAKETGPTS